MRRTTASTVRIATASALALAGIGSMLPAAANAAPITVTPGSSVLTVTKLVGNIADGRACTVGFIGQRPDGQRVGVYAGHCGETGQQVVVNGRIVGKNIASSSPRLTNSDTFVTPDAPDWGAFELDPQLAAATPGGRVRPNAVGTARVGDQVCSQGVSSGWRCGSVVSVDGDYIATTIPVKVGDSGGPLIRTSDNAALGIASRAATLGASAKPNGSLYYNLRPALNAAGLTLVAG